MQSNKNYPSKIFLNVKKMIINFIWKSRGLRIDQIHLKNKRKELALSGSNTYYNYIIIIHIKYCYLSSN